MGTRELRTEVKAAAAAEAEYQEAVKQGHSAAKVKQEPDSSIYTVDLGNLTAHELCVVRIHYLCLLECFAGTLVSVSVVLACCHMGNEHNSPALGATSALVQLSNDTLAHLCSRDNSFWNCSWHVSFWECSWLLA